MGKQTSHQYSDVSPFELDSEPEKYGEPGMQGSSERNDRGMLLPVLAILLSFLFGVLFGCTAVRVDATPPPQQSVVSYGFLHTLRGKELYEELRNQLLNRSPQKALSSILALIEGGDDQVASSCHPLIHKLGRVAVDELGFDAALEDVMGSAPDLLRACNAAYMHGVIENYMWQSQHDLTNDIEMIVTKLCNKLGDMNSGEWECHHGIGHGVMQRFRFAATQAAVTACNQTEFGMACENGVWMDHFEKTPLTSPPEAATMEMACDRFSSPKSTFFCQLYSPTEYLLHYPRQYETALQFCAQFEKVSATGACIQGVGYQTAKENRNQLDFVESVCLSAPSRPTQYLCFSQALLYYEATTGEKMPSHLCDNLVSFQDVCRGGAT